LRKIYTGETLHIRRDDTDYSQHTARAKLLAFIDDIDYLVAYEKSRCDRNRAKALLGEESYKKIADKFIDFQTLVVNRIISTNLDEAGKGYAQNRKLWTIYKYFFSDDDKSPVPLMEASESWASTGDKCRLDVHKLCNLFLVIRFLVN
jgi:hypothetical protein